MSAPPTEAERLAAILEEENAALAAMDIPRAVALLARKREAVVALEKLRANNPAGRRGDPATGQKLLRLAGENQRLLNRAMAAQMEVMSILAHAARQTAAAAAPRYGAKGYSTVARSGAVAFSARA